MGERLQRRQSTPRIREGGRGSEKNGEFRTVKWKKA